MPSQSNNTGRSKPEWVGTLDFDNTDPYAKQNENVQQTLGGLYSNAPGPDYMPQPTRAGRRQMQLDALEENFQRGQGGGGHIPRRRTPPRAYLKQEQHGDSHGHTRRPPQSQPERKQLELTREGNCF